MNKFQFTIATSDEMNKRTNVRSLFHKFLNSLTTRHYITFFLIIFAGIIFLLLAYSVFRPTRVLLQDLNCNPVEMEHPNLLHHIFRDIGISLFPIAIVALIYEYILRKIS